MNNNRSLLKRIITLMLVLVLLITMIPIDAFTARNGDVFARDINQEHDDIQSKRTDDLEQHIRSELEKGDNNSNEELKDKLDSEKKLTDLESITDRTDNMENTNPEENSEENEQKQTEDNKSEEQSADSEEQKKSESSVNLKILDENNSPVDFGNLTFKQLEEKQLRVDISCTGISEEKDLTLTLPDFFKLSEGVKDGEYDSYKINSVKTDKTKSRFAERNVVKITVQKDTEPNISLPIELNRDLTDGNAIGNADLSKGKLPSTKFTLKSGDKVLKEIVITAVENIIEDHNRNNTYYHILMTIPQDGIKPAITVMMDNEQITNNQSIKLSERKDLTISIEPPIVDEKGTLHPYDKLRIEIPAYYQINDFVKDENFTYELKKDNKGTTLESQNNVLEISKIKNKSLNLNIKVKFNEKAFTPAFLEDWLKNSNILNKDSNNAFTACYVNDKAEIGKNTIEPKFAIEEYDKEKIKPKFEFFEWKWGNRLLTDDLFINPSGGNNSNMPYRVVITYPYDYLKYGPQKINNFQLEIPEGIKFLRVEDWKADNKIFAEYKDKNCLVSLSDENVKQVGNKLTVTAPDVDLANRKDVLVGIFLFTPEKEYWDSTTKADGFEYDYSKKFQSGSLHQIKFTGCTLNHGDMDNIENYQTDKALNIHTVKYKPTETRYIFASGEKKTMEGSNEVRRILDKASVGEQDKTTGSIKPYPYYIADFGNYNFSGFLYNVGEGENKGQLSLSEETFPSLKNNGKGTVIKIDIDKGQTVPRIDIKHLDVPLLNKNYEISYNHKGIGLSHSEEALLDQVWVVTNKGQRKQISFSDRTKFKPALNGNQDVYEIDFPTFEDEHIQSVELHYSSLHNVGYRGSLNGPPDWGIRINEMKYDVNDNASAGDYIPLDYSVAQKKANGDIEIIENLPINQPVPEKWYEPPSRTNYIYIYDKIAPTFTETYYLGKMLSGPKSDEGYGDDSEFMLDENHPGFFGAWVAPPKDVEISNIKTNFKNLKFYFNYPDWGSYQNVAYYLTNGKLYMNKAIESGWDNWEAKVYTTTPAYLKEHPDERINTRKTIKRLVYQQGDGEDNHVWDLYKDLDKDEIIYTIILEYNSSKAKSKDESKEYFDLSKVLGTEKNNPGNYLITLGIDKKAQHPYTGLYYGGNLNDNAKEDWLDDIEGFVPAQDKLDEVRMPKGGLRINSRQTAGVTYDGIENFGKFWDADKYGDMREITKDVHNSYWKGAELLVPTSIKNTWSGNIALKETTTVKSNFTIEGNRHGYYKFYLAEGMEFRIKANDNIADSITILDDPQHPIYLSDKKGNKIAASLVGYDKQTKYYTIRVDGDEPVEIENQSPEDKKGKYSWDLNFSIKSGENLPADEEVNVFENDKSWIYCPKVEHDGKRYVMQSQGQIDYAGSYYSWNTIVNSNPVIKDDPLGVYGDTPANDLHWALKIDGWNTVPLYSGTPKFSYKPYINIQNKDSEAGNNDDKSIIDVYPHQERELGIKASLASPTKLNNVNTIITLSDKDESHQVKNDEFTKGELTSQVTLRLLKPIEINDKLKKDYGLTASYKNKKGGKLVDAKVEEAKYIILHIDTMPKNKKINLDILLRTEQDEDENFKSGSANLDNPAEKNCAYIISADYDKVKNEQNEEKKFSDADYVGFRFNPYVFSGNIWHDANINGVFDEEENKLEGITVNIKEENDSSSAMNPTSGASSAEEPQDKVIYSTQTDADGNFTIYSNQFKTFTLEADFGDRFKSTKNKYKSKEDIFQHSEEIVNTFEQGEIDKPVSTSSGKASSLIINNITISDENMTDYINNDHNKKLNMGLIKRYGFVYDFNGGNFKNFENKKIDLVIDEGTEIVIGKQFSIKDGKLEFSSSDDPENMIKPEKKGYKFIGWNTKQDGTGDPYAEGKNITLNNDMTLYAQWEKDEVVLLYDGNGAEEGEVPSQTVEKGTPVTVVENGAEKGFTREGYIFTCWNTQPDGKGRYFYPQDQITLDKNITLYAQWEKDEVKVNPIIVKYVEAAEGCTIPDGFDRTFTFKIKPVKLVNGKYEEITDSSIPKPEKDNVELNVTKVDSHGCSSSPESFDDIIFTQPGTYYYKISEVQDPKDEDIVYAEAKIVEIQVKRDSGYLEACIKTEGEKEAPLIQTRGLGGGSSDDIEFTNIYQPKAGTVELPKVTKELKAAEGYTIPDDLNKKFSFQLKGSNNAPMPEGAETVEGSEDLVKTVEGTVEKDVKGAFKLVGLDFGKVTFTKPETYEYEVSEVVPKEAENGKLNEITYDKNKHTISVEVIDNKGQLELSEASKEALKDITFTNIYKPAEGTVTLPAVKKVVEGNPSEAKTFTFKLEAITKDAPMPNNSSLEIKGSGEGSFEEIKFTKPETYEYKITEKQGNEAGYTYSKDEYKVTVDVQDNDGKLTPSITISNNDKKVEKIVFTNKYTHSKSKKHNKSKKETKDNSIDLLNRKDHYAYMFGYPDATFRPERPMTRAEVAAMFARLMNYQPTETKEYPVSYNDINRKDWYFRAVEFMNENGIVKGYPDGSFKPNGYITRAEFATMASRFDNLAQTQGAKFPDVPESHWASKYINSAVVKGWVHGYPDGTFKPERDISRAEVVTVTNHMLERKSDKEFIDSNEDKLIYFADLLDKNYWAYYEIREATDGHEYHRRGTGIDETWEMLNHKEFGFAVVGRYRNK